MISLEIHAITQLQIIAVKKISTLTKNIGEDSF
jgi:hypothetical protein